MHEFIVQCQAYNLLGSAVAVLDDHAVIRYLNPAFSQLNTNIRDSTTHLKEFSSLLDCPDIQLWIRKALQSNQTETLKQVFYYALRIQVTLTLCARPLISKSQEIAGIMLTLADESIEFDKRHIARAQDKYRNLAERIKILDRQKFENQELINILLKEAPVAMVLINSNREIIQSNRAAERLFGKTASQLIGQSCESIINCYQHCAHCPALKNKKTIEAEEIAGFGRNQVTLPLMRNAVVINRNNDPLIVEAFIDLSEHNKTKESLEKLTRFNQLLVESTGEGIFSVDKEMRCTFANQAAANMLDYNTEDLIGQDIHALFHYKREDETPITRDTLPITQVIVFNMGLEATEVFWNKSGHPIPVQYTCNPLHEGDNVSGAVIVYRNVSESRATARKLDYMATHDQLTGLLNRHAFEHKLIETLSQSHNNEYKDVLCYIDLDQFKIINDTCGHAAGDELLRQLSDLMHRKLRKADIFSRLGGDEFGLLLISCPLEKAQHITQSLLTHIAEYRFSWDNKTFSLGASIGIAELNSSITNAGMAMSAADAACYVAKERGRNRVHVFQADDQDLNQRHLEMQWVTRIKNALSEGRLMLMAQSIAPVENPLDKYKHMELLLRMLDEQGQIINPGTFITAAERYGFMSEVDKWVVIKALDTLTANPHYLNHIDYCCINLSGQSVTDEKFLEFLLQKFTQFPLVTAHICLEITETAAVANLSRAIHFMRCLKEVGCMFALDDFGSGMSSFGYLKNLPVDFLKIDGNFVRNMAHDKVDYAMVEAIHRVGNVMKLKTIAEFVEDDTILECLKHIGVDYAQGYGIHKPEPLDRFLSNIS
ncbi:MAG: EAL domain-containing protein [Gammaproteobacteria bacterium]|nr:EAL domain-containing protein [Gammaproteobacteria bacterium]